MFSKSISWIPQFIKRNSTAQLLYICRPINKPKKHTTQNKIASCVVHHIIYYLVNVVLCVACEFSENKLVFSLCCLFLRIYAGSGWNLCLRASHSTNANSHRTIWRNSFKHPKSTKLQKIWIDFRSVKPSSFHLNQRIFRGV